MPLTPEDVSNKRFTPVRLREGYDMGEVDQFLDEVEAELSRLTTENSSLRTQLTGGQGEDGAAAAVSLQKPATESAPPASQDGAAPAAAPAPMETIKVTTVSDASSAAARLLELATRNADQRVGEARDEADKIIGEARTKAERLDSESRSSAERTEAEARTRSQMLDSETAERREQLFGDLEREKDKLNGEVENLRSFEREYRSRLKTYFEQQLAALDGTGEAAQLEDHHEQRPAGRLRSLLGGDDDEQV